MVSCFYGSRRTPGTTFEDFLTVFGVFISVVFLVLLFVNMLVLCGK